MNTNIHMIKFIFTTTYLVLNLLNTSDAIKFEEDAPKNLASTNDQIKTNVEYIDDFDDVDERILTGGNKNRKKKSYTDNKSQNGLGKGVNKGSFNEKTGTHDNIADVDDDAAFSNEGIDGYTENKAPNSGYKSNQGYSSEHSSGSGGFVPSPNRGTSTSQQGNFNRNKGTRNDNAFDPAVNAFDTESSAKDKAPLESSNVIDQCLRDDSVGILPCISERTVSFLERYSHQTKDINIEDSLILSSNPDENYQSSRLIPQGEDPTDFRNGLEAMATFLQRRTIRYHLQALYPGLFIVVNPNYQGKGVIEFQLDRRNEIDDRQLSTSGLLMKRAILPKLLGFKITIISIIPIIFGLIYLITKKAMFLSKLALLVTSFVGFSSIAKVLKHHQHHQGNFHHSSSGGYGHYQGQHQGHQAQTFQDSILNSGALFGVATPVLAGNSDDLLYRRPGVPNPGEYNPEPELVYHTPNFKKEEPERGGKRVAWKSSM